MRYHPFMNDERLRRVEPRSSRGVVFMLVVMALAVAAGVFLGLRP
jgi:uncharacterized membrane protein